MQGADLAAADWSIFCKSVQRQLQLITGHCSARAAPDVKHSRLLLPDQPFMHFPASINFEAAFLPKGKNAAHPRDRVEQRGRHGEDGFPHPRRLRPEAQADGIQRYVAQ
jgi:hypothetical protein